MEIKEYATINRAMLISMATTYEESMNKEIDGLLNACEAVKEGDLGFLFVVLDHAAKAMQYQAKKDELEARAAGIADIESRL